MVLLGLLMGLLVAVMGPEILMAPQPRGYSRM